MLTRLIDELLPGIQVPPTEVMLMGDSQCTIACVEADDRVLDMWFSIRVAEVQDRMESWRRKGITVHNLYHWPGETNIADLLSRGQTGRMDLSSSATRWKCGQLAETLSEKFLKKKKGPQFTIFIRFFPY